MEKWTLADYKNYSELNKHVKQKAYAGSLKNCTDKAGGSLLRAQVTDGSGINITSTKDASTRTASAERLREPLPSKVRKELISLVQDSMQCANNSSTIGPPSQRKRVTAPSGKVDGKIFYTTPMPLHSSTISGGLLRSKEKRRFMLWNQRIPCPRADPKGMDLVIPDCYEDIELIPLRKYFGGHEGVGEYIWYRTNHKLEGSELLDISNAFDVVICGTELSVLICCSHVFYEKMYL
ncbi:uncharacterized protein LOC109793799 [Cajanus cajan]|uniref:uncharacterized protein LOC109793799 n=1 Tax=Cajanus cajan TaxID=3821 RepID=UPI00098DB715|nr:uncharacterized protein LOC109793799 [Cajanus cajan]